MTAQNVPSSIRNAAAACGLRTLIQHFALPDRYGRSIRLAMMPFRTMRQACWNTSRPSSSTWSLATILPSRGQHLPELFLAVLEMITAHVEAVEFEQVRAVEEHFRVS